MRLRRGGFTLVELLTVIGIIAILMAILFPVAAAVKKSVRKTGCVSNMHQIVAALKMYQNDERAYPPHLLPYDPAADPNNDPTKRGMRDAVGPITKYLKETNLLHCPADDRNRNPAAYSSPLINPFGDQVRDGNGKIISFYLYNSYDGQVDEVDKVYYQHYALDRPVDTYFPNSGDPNRKRLLKYRNPPDDTVVTFCKFHRDLVSVGNGYNVAEGSIDIVSFLSGAAKPIPSKETLSLPGFQRGQ